MQSNSRIHIKKEEPANTFLVLLPLCRMRCAIIACLMMQKRAKVVFVTHFSGKNMQHGQHTANNTVDTRQVNDHEVSYGSIAFQPVCGAGLG